MKHQDKGNTNTTPQVCVMRCEGQVLAQCWQWPVQEARVNLARVLADLGLQVADAQEMLECQLELTAHPMLIALRQGSQNLRCSLNGQVVEAGQLVLLQDGDVLEVGLCRFEVKPASWQPQPATPNIDTWADLTQLAPTVSEAVAAPDALDDLLESTHRAEESLAASRTPTAAPTVRPTTTVGEPVSQIDSTDVNNDAAQYSLQAWHDLYLRRLESPQEAMGADGWAEVATQQSHSTRDVLEMLMQQANEGPDLAALLGESAHISSVLAQLDAHGEKALLTPDEPINVMHLFAPEGWQAPDMQGRVPLLNRQEHHGMALDSVLFMPVPKATSEHTD